MELKASIRENDIHRSHIKRREFTHARAHEIASRVARCDRSDPFSYARTMNDLKRGHKSPEDFTQFRPPAPVKVTPIRQAQIDALIGAMFPDREAV